MKLATDQIYPKYDNFKRPQFIQSRVFDSIHPFSDELTLHH